MSITEQLASSLGRRDEAPNLALAKKIITAGDKKAVKELVENLDHKNKDIQSNSIKVIYEVAAAKPVLLSGHLPALVALLDHKNNRLQWGAMTALDALTENNPAEVYAALAKIIAVADKGSVITNDHCVAILIKLCTLKNYAADAFTLLNERLLKSPVNQLPMYAEQALPVINDKNKAVFIKTLTKRLPDIEKESKRKRVEKVLKKLAT